MEQREEARQVPPHRQVSSRALTCPSCPDFLVLLRFFSVFFNFFWFLASVIFIPAPPPLEPAPVEPVLVSSDEEHPSSGREQQQGPELV